jgi:hypothetical protein
LGIIIDSDLKSRLHIEHIYSKLAKFTSIFFKFRQKLTDQVMKLIDFAFVHSYILYGIEIHANTCCTYLDKLFKLNNKLLHILQNKPRSTPVNELYRNYGTLPVAQLHVYQLYTIVHKFLYHSEMLPPAFCRVNYFALNDQKHNHNVRNKKDLYVHSCRTTLGQRNTSFKAASLWNNLPPLHKEHSSVSQFKCRLTAYLHDQLTNQSDFIDHDALIFVYRLLHIVNYHCIMFIGGQQLMDSIEFLWQPAMTLLLNVILFLIVYFGK